MSEPIVWKRGVFQKFYAKIKIRVGGANPFAIMKGDEFDYDGSILKYSGMEVPQPQMRSAYNEGWYSLEPDDDSGVSPVVAPRNVAKSQTKTTDLAHVQRMNGQQMSADNSDEDTVMDVKERRPGADENPRAQPKAITKSTRQAPSLVVNPGNLEAQEGVEVGRIRTSSKLKIDMTKDESHAAKKQLDNIKGSGFIPNRAGQKRVIETEGITITTNVGNVDRSVHADDGDEGTVVGKVRHTAKGSSEGVEVQDTSSIRNKPVAPAPAPAKKIDMKLSPKVRVARAIDPNFPADWSFEGKLAQRMERVKEHGVSPTFLEALYAAEGDQMRKLLEKTYPKQFSA